MTKPPRWRSRLKAWLLHQRLRQVSSRSRSAWFRAVEQMHPELFTPGPRSSERDHRALWQRLRRDFSLNTFRICGNLSGVWDPRIVPLEVYTSEIEDVLCPEPTAAFLAHKSLYNKWFEGGLFPKTFLHNIDGLLFDEGYHPCSCKTIGKIAEGWSYPVVVKPNIHTKGGKDVVFLETPDALCQYLQDKRNYVVQERIKQHPFFERLNACGLNTLRCCVYRDLKDNSFHVVSMALRIGRLGRLDNLGQGGLACAVHGDGTFHPFGVDEYGARHMSHPDTGMSFEALGPLPGYERLTELLKQLAAQVWFHRLVSFDIACDDQNHWRVVEINLKWQTVSLSQFAGIPFFGEFTNEVVDHCLVQRL